MLLRIQKMRLPTTTCAHAAVVNACVCKTKAASESAHCASVLQSEPCMVCRTKDPHPAPRLTSLWQLPGLKLPSHHTQPLTFLQAFRSVGPLQLAPGPGAGAAAGAARATVSSSVSLHVKNLGGSNCAWSCSRAATATFKGYCSCTRSSAQEYHFMGTAEDALCWLAQRCLRQLCILRCQHVARIYSWCCCCACHN
jgi:hypothetical protein